MSSIQKSDEKSIEIKNVGPIEEFTMPVLPDGGLIVLKGVNGSGKTIVLESLEAMYDPQVRKTLRPTDGHQSGSVSGFGVSIRIGRANRKTGELSIESLEGRVDPSMLVDPGIKDQSKADAKRLEMLVLLGGVEIPLAKWVKHFKPIADELGIIDLWDENPILTAGRIARACHSVALKQQKLAKSKTAEGAALAETSSDVDITLEDDQAKLDAALGEATEALTKAETTREMQMEALKKNAAATAKLAELQTSRGDIAQVRTAHQEREKSHKLLLAEKSDLLEKLAAMDTRQVESAHQCLAAEQALKHAEHLEAQYDSAVESANSAVPTDAEMVREEDIEAFEAARGEALIQVEMGAIIRRAKESLRLAEAVNVEANDCAELSESYRQYAHSTDAVLEQALLDAGFDTIKIKDGRLYVDTPDRGSELFTDLSHGEQWRLALDLAAIGLPSHALLPIRQEAFESLDPQRRLEVAAMVKERKLLAFTALATDGELRATIMERSQFEFSDKVDGNDVDVKCYGYENSPEINVVGFERIEVEDMNGEPVDVGEPNSDPPSDYDRLYEIACESYEGGGDE